MVIDINKNTLSDHTERFIAAGLSLDFLSKMAKAVAALQSAGYEPYDQLYGYVMHGNDQYITRHGGATRTDEHTLIAAYSGERTWHLCP